MLLAKRRRRRNWGGGDKSERRNRFSFRKRWARDERVSAVRRGGVGVGDGGGVARDGRGRRAGDR